MSATSGIAARTPRLRVPALRTSNLLLAAALVGLMILAYFTVGSSNTTAKATPRTATVSRGVVLSSVSASGTVQAASDLNVNFETSGTVVSVDVKPGQDVQQGQTLGQLDSTDATNSVRQAEASLASAKANLLLAQTGETAQQRRADAISLRQSRASIVQAEASLRNARAQLRTDSRPLSLAQAQKQLRIDQGAEDAAVFKRNQDRAKLTVNGTTYATPDDAVAAWTTIVAQDKAQQQSETQKNYDLQAQQTRDQQQLSSDQASLQSAAPADKSSWQSKVNSDQSTVNSDALALQQQAKTLNQIQYQLSQDQGQLQDLQTLQSTLTQDDNTITSNESKLVSDRNQIANAKVSLATALVKDRQSIVSAKLQVASAKLGLQSTQANNAVKSTASPATLAQNRASVLQAEVALESAQRTLGETVLRAPVAGTVAAVNGVVGESVSGGGTSANSTSTSSSSASASTSGSSGYATLVDTQDLEVAASFSESDAAKIRLGQPATVTVSALPNEELAAHVIAVGTVGTTSSGVVQYTVTVALDNATSGVKPGMSANVAVTIAERRSVVNVANAAVTGSGSNATVQVVDSKGTQRSVPVVAGLKGDSTTEIVSGLSAGQSVVVSSGVSTTGGGSGSSGNRLGGGGFSFPGAGGGLPSGGPPGG